MKFKPCIVFLMFDVAGNGDSRLDASVCGKKIRKCK